MATLEATTLSHGTTILDEAGIGALSAEMRGSLVRPSDEGYEQARRIYNAMIEKRPALIARCRDVADVLAAVNFAREHDLLVSVRGGGHSAPGLSLCDGGLVIDLSLMKGIRVDPEVRTVRVQGGCTWGDVDHATHAFGLATVSGVVSTTGVGGLTLGGGHGYLTRRYGLTVDNLLSADVVLADGRLVTTSEEEHPDLFWAIRGGGGNFGVVTSFLFRLHPVSTVIGGPMMWPLERAGDVLAWYRDYIVHAPEDAYAFFAFQIVPPVPMFPAALHLHKVCALIWCHLGTEEEVESALAAAREVAPPVLDAVAPVSYPALQSMLDGLVPPGLQWYWKGDFVREISDDAIARHLEFASRIPSVQSLVHFYPINGAAHRVGKTATAFWHREANWSAIYAGADPDPASRERIRSWARSYWEALQPYSAGGAYVNFLMEEGQDRIRATYGDNYERLASVKAEYDPDNRFRVNQNILPAGRA